MKGDGARRVRREHPVEHERVDVDVQVDDKDARQGDYYYVRVRQANDAMAWSSPIWVGGYPSR